MKPPKHSPAESDRRCHPRSKPSTPLMFGLHAKDFDLVGEVRNLSRSGIYCRVEKPIAEMTRVMMVLELDSGRIKCDGTVVRAEPSVGKNNYHVAIFFNKISKVDQEKIDMFLEN